MNIEGVGEKEQLGEAGVALPALVPLNAAALHADGVGEVVLRHARPDSVCSDPAPEVGSSLVNPVGVRGTSAWHSSHAQPLVIMSQCPNGRFF